MRRGFTLVELMVVIAIIGIIASFSFASISQARSRARDNRRIEDLKLIQHALELYRTDIDHGSDVPIGSFAYPLYYLANDGLTGQGIYGTTPGALDFKNYLSSAPVDPTTQKNYIYFAPGCVHPGQGTTTAPTVLSPANDPNFHTINELQNGTALPAPCPVGGAWAPYVIAVTVENAANSEAKKVALSSQVDGGLMIVYTPSQPVYYKGESNSTPPRVLDSISKCYPANPAANVTCNSSN